jgi:sugar phosphate isomerase/epimerase
MKIGVSTYSFSHYITETRCDYFKVCDIAREIGFDAIDFIELNNAQWGIEGDDIKMAKELSAYCKALGLEISAYTVGANLLSDNIEAEVARLMHCVDVAAELGAPIMRHDVCGKLRAIPRYNYQDAIAEMVPHIRKVTEYAKSKGIRTCTENHGYIFQKPERVEELILAVGHENYGWLCDMGNFLCADADPEKAVAIAAPYVFHAHAKDFLYKDGSFDRPSGFFGTSSGNHIRGTVIGHGCVPVVNCITALKKAGYDGFVSIEFEGMEENIPALEQGLAFLRSIV